MSVFKRALKWLAARVSSDELLDVVASTEPAAWDLLDLAEQRVADDHDSKVRMLDLFAQRLNTEPLAVAAKRTEESPVDDAPIAAVESLADRVGVSLEDEFGSPLRSIKKIDDDGGTVYLHLLEAEAHPGAYADRLDKIYREHFGRSPRGLHVPVNAVEDLREVDPAYFEQQAAPWLREAESKGSQPGGDA